MGYLVVTSEGPLDVDPVRRARQDEGDEVMGVLRVGLSRSTVPRAAFSERQGGLCHGGIRDQDHDIDHMVPVFPLFGLEQCNLGKALLEFSFSSPPHGIGNDPPTCRLVQTSLVLSSSVQYG